MSSVDRKQKKKKSSFPTHHKKKIQLTCPYKRPYRSQFQQYQSFAETVPKSSFGKLLRKPVFLQAYKAMSDQKTVPKGLRENEVERGNFKKPPIPYIPVEDEIGEKVKHDSRTFKVKLDNKTTVNASV